MRRETPVCGTAADETIITWSDAEIGTDVALSFQEAGGCDAVWYIMTVQAPAVLSGAFGILQLVSA